MKVLIDELGAYHSPQDRWGNTPLDDALRHQHEEVEAYLTSKGAKLGEKPTLKPALKQPGGSLNGAEPAPKRRVSMSQAIDDTVNPSPAPTVRAADGATFKEAVLDA